MLGENSMRLIALKNIASIVAATTLVLSSHSAFAAYSFALAEYTGIDAIRTTGTVTATILSETAATAIGETTSGIDDPANDGITFDSEVSTSGEGTAYSFGDAASSLAEASGLNDAIATTLADIEIELTGVGVVEIDFGFDLSVESFDNGPIGFALAKVDVDGLIDAELFITGSDVTGIGSFETLAGVLTLSIDVDDFGLGPYSEFVGVSSLAEVSSVPVPAAVWLMGSALVGLVGYRRKA